MSDTLKTILEIIGGIIAGGIALKFVFKSRKSVVNQKGNVVFGDQAGRDINK